VPQWLVKILLALVLGLAAVLLGAHSRPDRLIVARTGLVLAPIDVVFDQADDFRSWEAWSPWSDGDPSRVVSYEGPESGEGAAFRWSSKGNAGSGRMEVVAEDAPNRLAWRLVFTEPFSDTAATTMSFEAVEAGTRVTWRLESDNSFSEKLADLFLDLETRIGRDFERGFERLGEVSRAQAARRASASSAGSGAGPVGEAPPP
jgi:hypothetical protein